jgi:hypothetical protein
MQSPPGRRRIADLPVSRRDLHHETFGIEATGTLERTFVVPSFDPLNPPEPHRAAALGARRVFQVIDNPLHPESKARTAWCVDSSNLTNSLGN